MDKRTRSRKVRVPERTIHCWEFFRCDPEKQKTCLIRDVGSTPCWLVNLPCCRMPADAARPISIKKVICKSCAFYLYATTEAR